MTVSIGRVGIWAPSFAWSTPDALTPDALEAVAELDELGFGALWLGASTPDLVLPGALLAATSRMTIATAIVNVWAAEADELAASFHRVDAAHPGRLLLGLGASHAPVVEALGRTYTQPLKHLEAYFDGLDAAPRPVPGASRVLAALRPKALELAARRTAGAHPYLVTPDHTRAARETLGDGPLLVPEQKVVLEPDRTEARRLARRNVSYYLALPNYVRNLQLMGFTDDDLTGEGSERLLDALYAFGVEQIVARVAEHHAAGADHVAVQVISADTDVRTRVGRPSRPQWRTLAAALL
ncbi:LLM class F420-dependent oxidoreductase [Frankia sp. AgPm24]|uniref:LLM class F420-dependent oxidoreductase n=1 Tax=Frankia sp. AgPm24 TaxID=631128 RepID=UPI00200CB29E|nr:LLM class F420-dependent oxidoreductase [Frankia sp. AgPm24]MCK9921486.1 LLM class F420-dependent oxidoreductase [Frankia sp. AgPm24]